MNNMHRDPLAVPHATIMDDEQIEARYDHFVNPPSSEAGDGNPLAGALVCCIIVLVLLFVVWRACRG